MRTKSGHTAHLNAALVLISQGEYQQVHTQAIGMIKANVRDPVPYFLLAIIASDHGNHIKATELFERAANLEPDNPRYHAFHGKELTMLGHQDKAKAAADRAAAHPVDDAHIADTIGVIYSRTGFHENAITFLSEPSPSIRPGELSLQPGCLAAIPWQFRSSGHRLWSYLGTGSQSLSSLVFTHRLSEANAVGQSLGRANGTVRRTCQ